MSEALPEVTPLLVLGCGLAALFAGISKGGFGSGAAFGASAILAVVIPPGAALGIMLPILMLIDAVTLKPYWRRWSWLDTKILIAGAVPGVALGAWLYTQVSSDVIRVIIGAVALLFVAWQVIKDRLSLGGHLPLWTGGIAGIVTGFTSFISHAGGPPAAVYMLSRGMDKTTYQASTVLLFWIVNIAKFIPYAFLGLFTWQTLVIDLFIVPFALLGAWIGVKAHHRVPERLFFALTYLFLIITGAKLVWDGLS
ncbi:MAG: sulfite exporter TauE/SafE family protein [Rhodobacteraceae bacterium]|nr:sulfite exporter TauE/SafE family protein [Paracoccaceae bacterium]